MIAMNKLCNILKLAGLIVCFVLLLAFLFIDIIDLIVPGDFPDWVFVAEIVVWVTIGVSALVSFIKNACKERKTNKRK